MQVCKEIAPQEIQTIKNYQKIEIKNKMNSIRLQNNSDLLNDNNAIPKSFNSVTIGTQTEQTSNVGRGTETLETNGASNSFENPQPGNNPLQLANLHKVINEHFIAESIKT